MILSGTRFPLFGRIMLTSAAGCSATLANTSFGRRHGAPARGAEPWLGHHLVTMRVALTEIPPFSMRVATLMLGAAVLTIAARVQARSLVITSRRTWAHICVASLFNIVAFSVFTPFAQLAAETSRVAIMVYTMPIWAAMLALPILGERLTATRLTALALCIAGMAILIAPLAALDIRVESSWRSRRR